MKYKSKLLIVLTIVIMFIFYRVDSVIAMANDRSGMSDTNAEPGQSMESAVWIDEPEQNEEPTAESVEPEQNDEPTAESAEPEQNDEPIAESAEPEQNVEPTVGLAESEQTMEPTAESAQPKQTAESAPDLVSTGSALIEWLESHKNTGGTVRLSDHVSLDGDYIFCPDGMNMPAVVVDTDQYTITVTGEIEFLSDHHLFFAGQPDGKSIFYVKEKGMLSMAGVTVESGQCALWQEEGAGLVVDDCCISGNIHYADIPFVVNHSYRSVCIILGKDQTLGDVLPASIDCEINRQGQVSHEPAAVVWNLEGTEQQQERRRRFQLQGTFVQAVCVEPLLCTVVYNDYPLTFAEVRASRTDSMYMFAGWYTKQENILPVTLLSEYSFNGTDWFTDEVKPVSDHDDCFLIAFPVELCSEEAHSDIYIRLRCESNGTEYLSNVLRYAANNLDGAEDIGGSRGGGTSITRPPEDPQKSTGDTASKGEKQAPAANQDTGTDSDSAGADAPSDTNQTENDGDSGLKAADAGQVSNAAVSSADAGHQSNAAAANNNENPSVLVESKTANAGRSLYADVKTGTNDNTVINTNSPDNNESINRNDSDISEKEDGSVIALPVYGETSVNAPMINAETMRSGIREDNAIIIAVGFVLLSVIAGTVGFYIQSRRQRAR